MQLNSKHFGTIDIDENGIINFSEGLPGFEEMKRYVLLGDSSSESPFSWLQSVEKGDLVFAAVNPFLIKKDYDIEISDEALSSIDIKSQEDILILSIVVVPEDISKISMNLKAPVVINTRAKKGIQVILDTDKYSVRHYILDELRGQEVFENAGSDEKKGAVNSNK